MQIATDVLTVLEKAEVSGAKLFLGPPGSLDRKLYVDTNKVLAALGGKWNKSAKAHVFDGDAATIIGHLLDTGEYSNVKQDLGQFDSPPAVVARVIELANIRPGMDVLEPSAGIGNIVRGIVAAGGVPHAFEIDDRRRSLLTATGLLSLPAAKGDFLTFPAEPSFDRVVMNPPFAGQVDIDHVLHAAKFLKPGGRLVSVMSASITFRGNSKASGFRDFVEGHNGATEMLPDNAFAASGTAVKTCIVSLVKS